MSTAPSLVHTEVPGLPAIDELPAPDEARRQFTDQDERVVNRLGAARGMISGIIVGAALWAGLILAGATLIHK